MEKGGSFRKHANGGRERTRELSWLELGVFLGCVSLGNLELDFEIRILDFAIKGAIKERISTPKIRPQGGFQLRNATVSFCFFLFVQDRCP